MTSFSRYQKRLLLSFIFLFLSGCRSGETPESPELIMINVNPEYFMENVSVGDVINYSAIGYYSDNSTLDITEAVLWLSSDVRIVTVDDSGIAVALKYGKANIYALHGGIYSNIQKINIKNSN